MTTVTNRGMEISNSIIAASAIGVTVLTAKT